MRPVTVGATQGDLTAISKGLAVGDVVVTDGVDKLQQGAHVSVQTAALAPGEHHPLNLSRPFILRPVATSLLMVGLMLAGLVAYGQLPVSALPQVDYPTIQVMTFYPGASPDVMASSVTAPLERQFGQVPGLNQMTSNSSFGSFGHHAAVRSQFEHRCCRAGSAGGDQCGRDLPADGSARIRPSTARPIRPTRRS